MTKLGVLEQVQTYQRGNYVKTRIYHLQRNFFQIVLQHYVVENVPWQEKQVKEETEWTPPDKYLSHEPQWVLMRSQPANSSYIQVILNLEPRPKQKVAMEK